MAGPVSVGSPAVTVSKPFKQPFKAVAQLSHKTGAFTKPIDPAISKSLDFLYSGITTVKTKAEKAPKINPYLLAALGLLVSGALSLALVIPALIFFPVTIFFGIATSFALIALAPLGFVFGWILLSSAPVQDKVVVPALDTVLKNKKVAAFLLRE